MRLYLLIISAILIVFFPLSVQAEDDLQSIIIEVDGDPEEHKKYIESYHPYIEVIETYELLFNGLAIQGDPKHLEKMESLEFIKAIHSVQTYQALPFSNLSDSKDAAPITDPSKAMQDENLVTPSTLNDTSYTGKGVKVAVIDTGIDYEHPDLAVNYRSGFDLVDLDDDPMETKAEQGMPTLHGSHVSGIIAANGDLQGVAPDAEIYAYRALGPGGAGTSVQVIAAMEQAARDDVDVMNLSLGNTVNGPDYPTSVAVNKAVELGIPVVIANGNSGPNNWTVGAPATATKAFSVGASTNPQNVPFLYERLEDKPIALQMMVGSEAWNLERPYPVVDGQSDMGLRGKIALLKRGGEIPFYELAKEAENKGAKAVLIANNEEELVRGSIENAEDPVSIPVAMLSQEDGEWLLKEKEERSLFLDTSYQEVATTIAPFSSRGPVTVNWNIKPDILAPGTNIISTVPGGYQALQGTSMAAPHVAGVMALMKEAHPDWSIEQLYGAIETTASPLVSEEGKLLDPIIQGMGIIQPQKAIDTETIIHDAQLAFGKIEDYNETKTLEVEIENTTNQDQTYSFDIPNKQRGVTWNLPQSFTVKKQETKNIPIELSITTPQVDKGLHQGWLTLNKENGDHASYQLPYLFINQAAENPKAMGFEFSLKTFSEDSFAYNIYLTEKAKRVEVDLYDPQSLLFNRTLLVAEDLDVGMNEGEMKKSEVGKPGQYAVIVTVYLEDGTYESYETMLFIE
ncbi:S8 family serine peptidase [Oceanobacillus halophilus]|uniref:Peptidase S8 n=1 Tax=Oceanobacillus halophilus TaxID=930130 RepID=A0A495A540_9BACI|nr:S8 family serine peptidase [Oceanobacillus halophilus]RKQ34379.1 peptidase S8 [Oceanobacillus halophilus]